MNEQKDITCKLRNGTEVLLSEGDRVLALRMVKDGMPITVDADYIIDDVLATLEDAQQTIAKSEDRTKLLDKLMASYNDYMENGTTKQQSEFIHVFRRIVVEHHMELRRVQGKVES